MSQRTAVLERCRHVRADEHGILVGAAIGTGLVAEAAIRGGVDLLIALTAGRFRMMGGSSLTCMMPIADSNAVTAQFARSEILAHSTVPVFFGANCMDPRLDLDDFLAKVSDWGFAGVTNFPSALFVNGRLRDRMEAAGIGFGREVELVQRARHFGLATIAYVQTPEEARVMADAPADIVNINLGWNQGGSRGLQSHLSVRDAGGWARLARAVDVLLQKRMHLRAGAEGGLVLQVAAVTLARLPDARDLDALRAHEPHAGVLAFAREGHDVVVAHPEGYDLDEAVERGLKGVAITDRILLCAESSPRLSHLRITASRDTTTPLSSPCRRMAARTDMPGMSGRSLARSLTYQATAPAIAIAISAPTPNRYPISRRNTWSCLLEVLP